MAVWNNTEEVFRRAEREARPGERFQALIGRARANYWLLCLALTAMLVVRFVWFGDSRSPVFLVFFWLVIFCGPAYRCVVLTDQRLLVFRSNWWSFYRPGRLDAAFERNEVRRLNIRLRVLRFSVLTIESQDRRMRLFLGWSRSGEAQRLVDAFGSNETMPLA